jgi:hypothetical protein
VHWAPLLTDGASDLTQGQKEERKGREGMDERDASFAGAARFFLTGATSQVALVFIAEISNCIKTESRTNAPKNRAGIGTECRRAEDSRIWRSEAVAREVKDQVSKSLNLRTKLNRARNFAQKLRNAEKSVRLDSERSPWPFVRFKSMENRCALLVCAFKVRSRRKMSKAPSLAELVRFHVTLTQHINIPTQLY